MHQKDKIDSSKNFFVITVILFVTIFFKQHLQIYRRLLYTIFTHLAITMQQSTINTDIYVCFPYNLHLIYERRVRKLQYYEKDTDNFV